MPSLCDKCGAPTRWYDEKCPSCGATQAIEIPTAAIALPRFASASPRRDEAPVEPTFPPAISETSSPTETQETTQETPSPVETQETPSRRKRSQRLIAFRRAVDAWRSACSPETASVTLARGRAVRYAVGIVAALFVCPPCAILAAYFFTRALFADRRANYHEAMLETEKARRSLLVGLGVFATFLCAFIFYVQSQELVAPKDSEPASLLFKK